jgi:hypothetical protein
MNPFGRARALALAVFVLPLALGCLPGCAKSGDEVPHRIAEAYRLMDRSENAKAVLVLQDALAEEPGSEEARVLLASAYMGLAGIDIYTIWDNFHDLRFNRSLGDMFLKGGDDPKAPKIPPAPGLSQGESPPVKSLVERIDRFMAEMRNIVSFLNRFPAVPRDNWVLLTQAISNLDASLRRRT